MCLLVTYYETDLNNGHQGYCLGGGPCSNYLVSDEFFWGTTQSAIRLKERRCVDREK